MTLGLVQQYVLVLFIVTLHGCIHINVCMYMYISVCVVFFLNRGHDRLLLIGLMYILYHLSVYLFFFFHLFLCD